jgi:polyisoprenoid-binding protein YceI
VKNVLLILLLGLGGLVPAQTIYFTRAGHIWFFSSTPIENIEAHNHNVVCAFEPEKGQLEFQVRIKDFKFEKDLMRDHFNENYLESDKYEYATFKGNLTNWDANNKQQPGSYPVQAQGKLIIHGVTQNVNIAGTVTVFTGGYKLASRFEVTLTDYKIKVPKIVVKNIAQIIQVTVDANLDQTQKSK